MTNFLDIIHFLSLIKRHTKFRILVSVWIGYSSIVPIKSHWANRSRPWRSSSREHSISQINITSLQQWRVLLITIFLSRKTSRCENSQFSWITTRWPPRIRLRSQGPRNLFSTYQTCAYRIRRNHTSERA